MTLGVLAGTIGIVLVTIVFGLLLDRRAPVVPRPERADQQQEPGPGPARGRVTEHAAGESPATALRVEATQLARLHASQRCPGCGGTMALRSDELVRYDGADLHVVRYACAGCDHAHARYVEVEDASGPA